MESENEYTVLLVDDLPANIDILVATMSKFRLLIARSGEKALKIVRGDVKPDLILLDVEMPGMNGYETCMRIREDHTLDDIPVIFITAKTGKDSILHGFEVGGQDYVTKPFDPGELMARVNTQLDLKHSKKQLTELNELLERRVKERTTDLQSTLEKLKVTNKELDTFVYRASHDLKAPVASLLGLVYLGKESSPAQIPEILDKMEITVTNLDKVLDELIIHHDISHTSVHAQPIRLEQLIERVQQQFLNGKFPAYRIVRPDHFPVFLSDVALLEIIFKNLIENALIFNSSESVVIRIALTVEDHICIIIEDNGDGIGKEMEHRVFDLFFRGSMKSRGNGMGLFLVKKALGKLQGKIELETEEGSYSRFILKFPVMKQGVEK